MQFYYFLILAVPFLLCVSSGATATTGDSQSDNYDTIVGSRALHKSPDVGSETGDPFDDIEYFSKPGLSPISAIHELNISSTAFYIDSIQVAYTLANLSDCQAPMRGTSRNPQTISLGSSEHIARIEGSTNGIAITELIISTIDPEGAGKTYGPFGKASETEFSFQGFIVGFYGKSETFLNNFGVYYFDELKKSKEFGVLNYGSKFDDKLDNTIPPVIGISTITLYHGALLNGIQVEYILLGGNKVLGKIHGDTNATLTTIITLEKGQQISNVEFGHSGIGGYISMLNFTVKGTNGITQEVGPFGDKGEIHYSIDGNILGFFGHCEKYINKLGFYYT